MTTYDTSKRYPHGSLGWCYGRAAEHLAYGWGPKGPSVGNWTPTAEQREAYMAGYRKEQFPPHLDPDSRPAGKWEN